MEPLEELSKALLSVATRLQRHNDDDVSHQIASALQDVAQELERKRPTLVEALTEEEN